jgi:DNA-binding MarR family transcriptional regulator
MDPNRMLETYEVNDLEQVRLLADPLKLKLLQAFAETPRTVREVAAALGENLTRLYRHVDALHAAGLIEITQEEKKRGTVERTFRAVARRFEVNHALFAAGADGKDAIRDLLRAGEEEMLAALDRATDANPPLVMRLRIKGTPAHLKNLRRALEAWLADARDDDDGGATEEAGALIAFYPIAR